MKLLVVFSTFLVYFFSISVGLECYKYNNFLLNEGIEREPHVKVCKGRNSDFCYAAAMKKSDTPFVECDHDEFCIEQGCIDDEFCNETGTFERGYPGLENKTFTISCCEEDLCNLDTPANASSKTGFNVLLYTVIFYLFVFIRFLLINF